MLLLTNAFSGEATTLADMLAKVKGDQDVTWDTRPLSRDWIGDITNAEGKMERLRLEKGRITKGEISLLRTYPNGGFMQSDAPVYVTFIPADDKIRSCKTVAELKEILGPGQPSFDGWGGPDGIHSSHSWVCFSPAGKDRLTYISVFADTLFHEEQQAKGVTQVNKLRIRRGELRPADPSNPKELDIYLSGAGLFAKEEAEKARERQRYPQPLRELILAKDHPEDSDLKHLSAAIQAIRNDPDPKLFAQLVQEMHEGTLKIRGLLNNILLNEYNLLRLKPWGYKQEAIAVGACIDSLPLAKDSARDDLIETLLRVCGGGKIEIESINGGRSIEVRLTKDEDIMIIENASHPLSLGEAQQELRRRYKQSRAEQQDAALKAAKPRE